MATTREQFQSRLTDSGIMSAADLDAFTDDLPHTSVSADPGELAQALVDAKHLTAFQAEVLLGEAARPLRLGNYLLLDRVGSGGMGHVHKAVHERMNRVVALKVLPPLAAMDAGLVKRFRREVEVAAKLHHPNVVTAYDADEAGGVHFLVMELVEGRDLGRVVKEEGPLPVDVAMDCIEQAARGLAYAHGEGVLHRDVKPANLLRDASGRVKVLDMGLARLDTSENLTTTGDFLGTAMTMAPEQGEDIRLVDERSDVYGLGCTLYYLLAGRHVYQADSAVQMLLAHARDPVPRLRDARPDAPEALEQLFESMVQKDRDARPANMQAVVAAIEAIRTGETPSVPAARPTRTTRRPRWALPAAALALVALAAWWILGGRGTGDEESETRAGGPLLHTLRGHRGTVHGVTVHPDGKRILSASGDDTIGIWDLESGAELQRLMGHTDAVRSVICLSDGNTVISSSDDTSIRIWDLTRRATVEVLAGHEAKVRELALAPDESWFASASKDGTLRIWDLPSGTERASRSEHGPWPADKTGLLSVAVRADGKALATAAFDQTVRVWNTETFTVEKTLGPHESDVGQVAFSADGSRLLYDLEAGHVRVMDGKGDTELAYLAGHDSWVYSIACAHHAPIAATGSEDWSICLWNYETGELLTRLEGHEFTIGALAFSPNDHVLVSGSGDETIRVWDVRRFTTASD